jgi:hypothetical protein
MAGMQTRFVPATSWQVRRRNTQYSGSGFFDQYFEVRR